jgi:hypothetical protein
LENQKYAIDSKTSILQALYTLPYLTADRVTKLLFSPGSLQGVRQHLKELTDMRMTHREYLFSQVRSKEYVYWLATSGRRKLRGLNSSYDFSSWKEPKQMGRFLSSPHFTHHMTTTDMLIAFLLTPDIQIQEAMHYFHIRLSTLAPVLPDGLVKMLLPDGKHITLLLEVDLNSESDERIKEKIVTYLPYISRGGFAKDYGIDEVPLIVFYTLEEKRREKLLSVIEKALLDCNGASKASWFLVGSGNVSPECFFENRWITPAGLSDRNITSLIPV